MTDERVVFFDFMYVEQPWMNSLCKSIAKGNDPNTRMRNSKKFNNCSFLNFIILVPILLVKSFCLNFLFVVFSFTF